MSENHRRFSIQFKQNYNFGRFYYTADAAIPVMSRGPTFNPLNPELNPICYLLALLGAHHFLHVNRIRVKILTP